MWINLWCWFVLVPKVFALTRIIETLDGGKMNPIAKCSNSSDTPLQPHNIHIIISVTSNHVEPTKMHAETVRYYSMLHGYHFRIIDPTDLLIKFGQDFKHNFKALSLPSAVLNLKGLITLCKRL